MSAYSFSSLYSRRAGSVSALFLSGLIAASLAGCDRGAAANSQPAAAAAQRPPSPVSAFVAVSQDVPVYLDAIGKTVAVESVNVIPQVAGKIVAAHVEDGAYVTKGQLLFEIDPRPFEAALASANATLAQNQAEAAWSEADFKRTQELLPTNVISQLEFDQKKSNLGVSQAKIEAAKALIFAAQLNLEYTKIYSPIDGRAGVRLVDPGNVVKANEGVLLSIQRLDPIYAEFTVTENDLGTVRKFMAARGMEVGNEGAMGLKTLVDVPGDSDRILSALGHGKPQATSQPAQSAAGQPATQPTTRIAVGPREGKLSFLDNSVQGNTGTVKLRATLPNSDRYFWPGQFVNVRLVLTTRKDAVLVPAQAQQIGQQGPFVYVVKPDQSAEMRSIVPGQRQGDLMVVEQGLQAGELVVVSGQMAVTPNGKVMVTNQAAINGATAGGARSGAAPQAAQPKS